MDHFFFFFQILPEVKIMRQILQIALSKTKAHFLYFREFSLTCKHVATQPPKNINKMYVSKNTYGSFPCAYHKPLRGKNESTYLISNYKVNRGISKSSQPDNSTELSLENVKVQEYLKKLKEEHVAALRGQDEASAQLARSQVPLMRLLDQVRPVELQEGDKGVVQTRREPEQVFCSRNYCLQPSDYNLVL